MRLLRSALLDDARHGFSTRLGGASTGRYESLNVGYRWGDDPRAVDENRRRLAADGDFDLGRLCTVRQVHGATCALADGRTAEELAVLEADALVATEPGRAVAVYTADCVPILFVDGEGRVAAAHAGWRGTLAGVGPAALEALLGAGARRERVRAALGPSIGPCCFEVGEEVAAPFERLDPSTVLRRADAKPRVDLRRANAILLERAGLAPDRIDARALCTVCRRDLFFSFRRDGGNIGQMLSFAVAGAR